MQNPTFRQGLRRWQTVVCWNVTSARATIHLRLTEAALPIVKEGRSLQRRYGRLLFAGMSKDEIRQLMGLLDRVAQNVDAALEQDTGFSPPAAKKDKA